MGRVIRLIEQADRDAAVSLADEVFRRKDQTSMAVEYPEVFSLSLGQSIGMFEDGQLVSFLGLVPGIIHIGNAAVRVYSVGAVCTAPAARGRGCAGELLSYAMSRADQAGAALMLVSGSRSLYTRAHCCKFGSIRHMVLEREHMPRLGNRAEIACREMLPADWFRIKQLSDARSVRYEQSIADLAAHIYAAGRANHAKSVVKVFLAEDRGEALAFAVVSIPVMRGEAEQAAKVIEWAGRPPAVTALIADTMERHRLRQLEIVVPWHETAMLEALGDVESTERKNAGTVYIVDGERLFRQVAPYLESRGSRMNAGIEDLPDGGYALAVAGETSVELSAEQWVSLVFDPEAAEPLQDLRRKIGGMPPIPFPYTAGLNFI